jgi:protocatechuate 3,4-dioxygenase beta subunit
MADHRRRSWKLAAVVAAAVTVAALIWWQRPSVQPGPASVRRSPIAATVPAFTVAASAPAERQSEPDDRGAPLEAREVVLTGRVNDAGGGFIAGAQVLATSYAPLANGTHETRVFQAKTDDEGRYRLRLPSGRHRLQAEADGYSSTVAWKEVGADRAQDFVLQPAARISGRVLAAVTREPVAGARVSIRRDDTAFDAAVPGVNTDEQGGFLFSTLPPGTYRVVARKDTLLGALEQPVVLDATDAVAGVELLLAATSTVRGRVTSAARGAIVQARVSLSPMDSSLRGLSPGWVFTDPEGQYLVAGVPPGRYRLVVSAHEHAASAEPITVSADLHQDVVLGAPAMVTGTVLTGDGRPARNAMVLATVGASGTASEVHADAMTNREGRFSITGLAGGPLMVTVGVGNEVAQVGPEKLHPGGRKEITIRLQPGAGVTGVARWDDGSPIVAQTVMTTQSFGEGSWMRMAGRTGADGTFAIGGLPPGEVSLYLDAREGGSAAIGGGRAARVTLTLKPGEQRTGVDLVVARR